MPRIEPNAKEESHPPLPEAMEQELNKVAMHASYPTFVCGVSRRLNTGNFEHVDIYSGIGFPLIGILPNDLATFKKAIEDAAKLGFELVSEQTGKRYESLKEIQNQGRGKGPPPPDAKQIHSP